VTTPAECRARWIRANTRPPTTGAGMHTRRRNSTCATMTRPSRKKIIASAVVCIRSNANSIVFLSFCLVFPRADYRLPPGIPSYHTGRPSFCLNFPQPKKFFPALYNFLLKFYTFLTKYLNLFPLFPGYISLFTGPNFQFKRFLNNKLPDRRTEERAELQSGAPPQAVGKVQGPFRQPAKMPLLLRRCSAQKSLLRSLNTLPSKAFRAFDPTRGGRLPPRAPPPILGRIRLNRGFSTS